MLDDPDPQKAQRTMTVMLQMKKLDIAKLKQAHDG
jgi:predicted 3-demethylubiquinone-9 3-methyltransferase (glyoxalase superfamily)